MAGNQVNKNVHVRVKDSKEERVDIFAIVDRSYTEGFYTTKVYRAWQVNFTDETIEEIPIENTTCRIDVGEGYP